MVALSIVIPTKNRHGYLVDVVRYILSWKSQDFEVVVQDNSDDVSLKHLLAEFSSDIRLRYFHSSGWMSVIDNFNTALSKCEGQIVTMIGDDDGIMPWSIDIARWMIENKVESVLPERGEYTWPDLKGSYNSDYYNSKLRCRDVFTAKVSVLDPVSELNSSLKLGGCTLADMPRLYYGFISRKSLDIVKSTTGSYFPGPSPDMANASSCSLIVKNHYKLDFPVFISGSCSSSTSGLGVKRAHEGDIDTIKHLPKDSKKNWESSLPLFWSGPTVWAESIIKSVRAMKSEVMLDSFNFSYLYARCFVFNRRLYSEVLKSVLNNRKNSSWLMILYYYFCIWFLRFKVLLPKLKEKIFHKNSDIVIDNKEIISKALASFENYVKNSGALSRLNDVIGRN